MAVKHYNGGIGVVKFIINSLYSGFESNIHFWVCLIPTVVVLQRRNKKQVPSFRKLIKTSKVKLENKLKNKQFKQQSTIKKYRKEQRKLRQAVKDAVSKKPISLEDPKEKQPGNCESIHML